MSQHTDEVTMTMDGMREDLSPKPLGVSARLARIEHLIDTMLTILGEIKDSPSWSFPASPYAPWPSPHYPYATYCGTPPSSYRASVTLRPDELATIAERG